MRVLRLTAGRASGICSGGNRMQRGQGGRTMHEKYRKICL